MWLAGFAGLLAWRFLPSASFPQRRLKNVSLQCPAPCCFRLTVARRRRLTQKPLGVRSGPPSSRARSLRLLSGAFPPAVGYKGPRLTVAAVSSYSLLSRTLTFGRPFTLCSTVSC